MQKNNILYLAKVLLGSSLVLCTYHTSYAVDDNDDTKLLVELAKVLKIDYNSVSQKKLQKVLNDLRKGQQPQPGQPTQPQPGQPENPAQKDEKVNNKGVASPNTENKNNLPIGQDQIINVNQIIDSIYNLDHTISINNNYIQEDSLVTGGLLIGGSRYSTEKSTKTSSQAFTFQAVPISYNSDYFKFSLAYMLNKISGKYSDVDFTQKSNTFLSNLFIPLDEDRIVSLYGFFSYTGGNEEIKLKKDSISEKSEFSIITWGSGANVMFSLDESVSALFDLGARGSNLKETDKHIGTQKLNGTKEQTDLSLLLSSTIQYKMEQFSLMPFVGVLVNLSHKESGGFGVTDKPENKKDKKDETTPLQFKFGLGAEYRIEDIEDFADVNISSKGHITYSKEDFVAGLTITAKAVF